MQRPSSVLGGKLFFCLRPGCPPRSLTFFDIDFHVARGVLNTQLAAVVVPQGRDIRGAPVFAVDMYLGRVLDVELLRQRGLISN